METYPFYFEGQNSCRCFLQREVKSQEGQHASGIMHLRGEEKTSFHLMINSLQPKLDLALTIAPLGFCPLWFWQWLCRWTAIWRQASRGGFLLWGCLGQRRVHVGLASDEPIKAVAALSGSVRICLTPISTPMCWQDTRTYRLQQDRWELDKPSVYALFSLCNHNIFLK